MREISANEFRKRLKSWVDETISERRVLKVNRRNGQNFMVIGEDDWRAIEETIYLNGIPGLVESIHEADREPLEHGIHLEDLEW
ncbi:Antitoxin [Candidatus Desulfarcum epimagneticum]|uniref:Antitoxin n=1 Tax=uncultured Desulfobacteraceae bacterium TaxID=218296 RepID=A0A484HF92_9BACT|nr:Antitoxin [uncultured Desulfobacteraceae bacterium]